MTLIWPPVAIVGSGLDTARGAEQLCCPSTNGSRLVSTRPRCVPLAVMVGTGSSIARPLQLLRSTNRNAPAAAPQYFLIPASILQIVLGANGRLRLKIELPGIDQ